MFAFIVFVICGVASLVGAFWLLVADKQEPLFGLAAKTIGLGAFFLAVQFFVYASLAYEWYRTAVNTDRLTEQMELQTELLQELIDVVRARDGRFPGDAS